MSSFTVVAPFYDRLMAPVPYRMWVSYYLLLLAQQDIKPKRVLDVCCGTGTMCELLSSEEGMQMTGFDLSPNMIEQAREKARLAMMDIRYEVMDAATFDLNATFQGAFSFFDSLNYITDPNKLQAAFHRVADHLEPGASWIFDLNTAYAFEARMFDQKHVKKNAAVRYDWRSDWDPESRIIKVSMQFWTDEGEFEEVHVQRAHSEEEVRSMLAAAGFVEVKVYNSYTLNPPRAKSDRVHFTAVRAG